MVATAAFLAACATMQSRWEAAKSADTIAAYENFLEEYPEGDSADRARTRRDALQEEKDWKEAEAKRTVAACEAFRKKHPHGRYEGDVAARLDMLSRTRVTGLPFVGSEEFLKRYRRGVFLDEALLKGETPSPERAVTDKRAQAGDAGPTNPSPSGISAGEARFQREKLPAARPASGWGTIMYPVRTINIRANRSVASRLKGRLKAGQPVKADFLRDGWYAVFPVNQKRRSEKMALGYVRAPLLQRGADPPGPTAAQEGSDGGSPPQERETENLPVGVKNITFRIAGDGKELLFIEFDRFYAPTVSGIEGREPRIILEIRNASPLREDWEAIDTGGNLVRRIHSRRDAQTRAALIILDMEPGKSYFANPTFYKKEHIYSLEISEQVEIRLP